MTEQRPRRILMTADAVGGVWIYAGLLARALCSRGDDVTLVVMGPAPGVDQMHPLQNVPGLTVVTTDLALEWMDPEGHDTARARHVLQRLADQIRPDIVHINGYREAAFDWPGAVLVVAHSCVMSWWQACRGGRPDEARWDTYVDAVRLGLGAADAWVAPTAAFRDWIIDLYRPRLPGRVIPNGIEAVPATARKEPFILAAGRVWDEAKNLRLLAGIAGAVDWPVRVAGDTQAPTEGESPPIETATIHLGRLTHAELAGTMARATIFVAPSVYEPFGLSVLEAAAAGCALVLADIPTFRELWDGAALFTDPHRPDHIADTLRALCRDEPSRSAMGKLAAARSQRYSLQAMTAAYDDLYDELYGGGACPVVMPAEARV